MLLQPLDIKQLYNVKLLGKQINQMLYTGFATAFLFFLSIYNVSQKAYHLETTPTRLFMFTKLYNYVYSHIYRGPSMVSEVP